MSRADRRRKSKNRLFTKKGFTRVILKDNDGKLWNIPTHQNSRINNLAKHNVRKMHHEKKIAYQSKEWVGR